MISGKIHFLLKVDDLNKSKIFYELLFASKPVVDEVNIVEFEINSGAILGLISDELLSNLFGNDLPERYSSKSSGISEVYLELTNADKYFEKSKQLGCIELSPFKERNWGHKVGYVLNHDGHIIAFAENAESVTK